MVNRYKKLFSHPPEIVNIHDVNIKGGCVGCLKCWHDYRCVYQDEFIDFFEKRLMSADVAIFAGALNGRFLSSKWKQFMDRLFFNHHRPTLIGKQMGLFLSGSGSENGNISGVFQAISEFSQCNFLGCVTDEFTDSERLDASLQRYAQRTAFFAQKGYVRPPTFLGVGATKIFRDGTWGKWRISFPRDHKYYKVHGIYDFPQYDYKTRFKNTIISGLNLLPPFRRFFTRELKNLMILDHQMVVKKK